jgi:hypothetical protein
LAQALCVVKSTAGIGFTVTVFVRVSEQLLPVKVINFMV